MSILLLSAGHLNIIISGNRDGYHVGDDCNEFEAYYADSLADARSAAVARRDAIVADGLTASVVEDLDDVGWIRVA